MIDRKRVQVIGKILEELAGQQLNLEAFSIGASILLTLCAACFFGLTVPALLHAFKLDPKIAAGPVTLAFTDIFTLLFYFSLGALLL